LRRVVWLRLDSPGRELCPVATEPSVSVAGAVVAPDEAALAVSCQVNTYPDVTTREVPATLARPNGSRRLILRRSAAAGWQRMTTKDTWCFVPALNGDAGISINDVDLPWTPATNTLPLRPLQLPVGAAATVIAAWVRWPTLDVHAYEGLWQARPPLGRRSEASIPPSPTSSKW